MLAGLAFEGSLTLGLRGCDLGRDGDEVEWDWLHRLPVLARAGPHRRAPWRFRFKLDDALERALCEERPSAAEGGRLAQAPRT